MTSQDTQKATSAFRLCAQLRKASLGGFGVGTKGAAVPMLTLLRYSGAGGGLTDRKSGTSFCRELSLLPVAAGLSAKFHQNWAYLKRQCADGSNVDKQLLMLS